MCMQIHTYRQCESSMCSTSPRKSWPLRCCHPTGTWYVLYMICIIYSTHIYTHIHIHIVCKYIYVYTYIHIYLYMQAARELRVSYHPRNYDRSGVGIWRACLRTGGDSTMYSGKSPFVIKCPKHSISMIKSQWSERLNLNDQNDWISMIKYQLSNINVDLRQSNIHIYIYTYMYIYAHMYMIWSMWTCSCNV